MTHDTGTKRCGRCKTDVPLENFSRQARSKDGRQSNCKSCMVAYQAAWYLRNKERLEPIRSEYRADHKDEMSAYQADWYEQNKDRKNAGAKVWRDAHGEIVAERGRQWRARTPARQLEYSANRRAMLRGVWDEDIDRSVVWERDGGICHLCGEPADPSRWDLDHIIPLTPYRGREPGRHNYENVAVSHPSCNYRKCNRGTRGYSAA